MIEFVLFALVIWWLTSNSSPKKTVPTKKAVKPILSPFEENLSRLRQAKFNTYRKEFEDIINKEFNYKLSDEQINAIFNDSERAQIIASAGSGKSTTLLAKYIFLIKSGLAKQNEILVLAFNKNIKEELDEKIKDIFSSPGEVYTFHGFAKNSIEKNLDQKINISKYAAEDHEGLLTTQNIEKIIKKAKAEYPNIHDDILLFRAITPYQNITKFAKDEREYNSIIATYPYKRDRTRIRDEARQLTIPALDGKSFVKSQEELQIANYLTTFGVDFEYERELFCSDVIGNKIFPDFYYPELNLYHEHFAINKDGNAPSHFEKYKETMEKKKKWYQASNTDCIYTYSHEFEDGTIFEKLAKELTDRGIKLSRISNEELEKRLEKYKKDDTYKLFREAIKLAKANEVSAADYEAYSSGDKERLRFNYFKKAFVPIYATYEKMLKQNAEYDFEDLINLANKGIKGIDLKFKYVLIDEYQDISKVREKLLVALKQKKSKIKIFQVGDDWQSIYRFTGSDNSFIRDFSSSVDTANQNQTYTERKKETLNNLKNYQVDYSTNKFFIDLGKCSEIPDQRYSEFKIQQNFRTETNINKLASIFILKNNYQIEKKPHSTIINNVNSPINFVEVNDYNQGCLARVINLIPRSDSIKNTFILGRDKFNFREDTIGSLSAINRNDLNLKKSTIHSAKGLEAENIIIFGNEGGLKGFPKQLDDDPLLKPFLPTSENYPYAEERRVMYVALTRAKESVYIVYKAGNPSEFVHELVDITQKHNLPHKIFHLAKYFGMCPECIKNGKRGFLRNVSNRNTQARVTPKISLLCNIRDCNYNNYKEPGRCPRCAEKGELRHIHTSKIDGRWIISCSDNACDFKMPFHQF